MKSKYLGWVLTICLLSVTTALGQVQKAKSTDKQKAGSLAHDVILIPVDAPVVDSERIEADTPFSIVPTFAADVTPQQMAVFQQAINEWLAIIRTTDITPSNYSIAFSNGAAGGSLAVTTTTFNRNNGNLIRASIVFDNTSTNWYVDPNPADDTEFNGTPPAGTDLLTVARHELGHALGWAATRRVTTLLTGNVFAQNYLDIETVNGSGGLHTNPNIHSNDIMTPTLAPSTRQPISLYPAAAMLARAYFYDITMSFVDSDYAEAGTGSAHEPWQTVQEGADLTPFGQLLLAPRTYNETMPITFSRPMTIKVPRGGNAVIGKQPAGSAQQ